MAVFKKKQGLAGVAKHFMVVFKKKQELASVVKCFYEKNKIRSSFLKRVFV